jgi:hypothetical protein
MRNLTRTSFNVIGQNFTFILFSHWWNSFLPALPFLLLVNFFYHHSYWFISIASSLILPKYLLTYDALYTLFIGYSAYTSNVSYSYFCSLTILISRLADNPVPVPTAEYSGGFSWLLERGCGLRQALEAGQSWPRKRSLSFLKLAFLIFPIDNSVEELYNHSSFGTFLVHVFCIYSE